MHVGDQESEESWSTLFRSRKQRGLKGVDIVASDAHGGRVKAVERHFQGVMWQRCQAHRTRNVLMATPKRAEMLGYLRRIFSSPSKKAARGVFKEAVSRFEGKADKALNILEDGMDAATQVLVLPDVYRRRLRTTNTVERLNRGDTPS